jgi:exodeoxyribonuclease-5
MHFTKEQKDVIKGIVGDIDNCDYITFGGLAGSGKTTVSKVLMQILKEKKRMNFRAAAFTGKATNVLRKKGIPAETIHSTIYVPVTNEQEETEWHLVSGHDLEPIDGFIIDEASMVGKEIHTDLMSFGLPIIYIGDHGQLEPIGGKFNLMENPMYKLETVHRNAGEIAHFAYHLRTGNPAHTFQAQKNVQIVQKKAILDKHLATVDQVICAYNKSRVALNEKVRAQKGIEDTFIAKNEKIICLRNSRRLGLFNGMQGTVLKIRPENQFDFISEGITYKYINYDPDQFGKDSYEFKNRMDIPFDYAYAITAHKSQGDEFGSVIAYEEKSDLWGHARWCYTVASRAKNSLIWGAYETYTPSYLF